MFLWDWLFIWIMGIVKIIISDYWLLTYVSLAIWNWHFLRKCLSVLFFNVKDYLQSKNVFSHRILIDFPEKKNAVKLFLGQSKPANCINYHSLFITSPLAILFGTVYAKVLIPFVSGFCFVWNQWRVYMTVRKRAGPVLGCEWVC